MTEEERRAQRARIAAIERKYNQTHLRNLAQYQAEITRIFEDVAQEAARLGVTLDAPGGRMLSFNDLPAAKRRVNAMLKAMRKRLEAAVVNGIDAEWALANGKNDAVVEQIAAAGLTKGDTKVYFNSHAAALKAFKARKTAGIGLSRRVWNLTQQYKSELEMALDCGIRDGLSAQEMARQLKQYLNYPDKLFRRVRDEHGVLQLSKAAAAFHPGRGVYRSSHKNALRLAGTETNIAYRTADHERVQALDFVLGIKIVLSNNHTIRNSKGQRVPLTDICDELAGSYPKGFKFTGWHPNCRCHTETILLSGADFENFIKAKREGRAYDITKARGYVAEPPAAFKAWVKGNAGRIAAAAKAGTTPYFIKDNQGAVDALLGQSKAASKPAASTQPAQVAKEPTEIEALAKRLGIEAGEPMTHEQANTMRPNPHFQEDEQYQINCQSAVVTYELRRRGLDIEAFGNPGSPDYAPRWLSYNTRAAWLTDDGKLPEWIYRVREVKGWTADKLGRARRTYEKPDEVWLDFADKTKAPGRYHISWTWKNERAGHIITMEVSEKGRRSFYDPQTGQNSRTIITWLMDGRKCRIDLDKGIWGYRVDNAHPNAEIVRGVVKKAGSKAKTPKISAEAKDAFLKLQNGKNWTQAGATSQVGAGRDPGIFQKQKEVRKDRSKFVTSVLKDCPGTKTGKLWHNGQSRKAVIAHLRHEEEIPAAEYAWSNPQELHFVKKSPLGEGKDMSTEKAQNNIARKTARGVQYYNLYEFEFNGKTWHMKMEVIQKGAALFEQFYSLVP